MDNGIKQFRANIDSVKELDKIYTLVISNFPLLTDEAGEILRAEIVLAVSAMDCFIHDITRKNMVEQFTQKNNLSKSFSDFEISIQSLAKILGTTNPMEQKAYLDAEIRRQNSSDSYQSPKSIEYALQLINIDKVWSKIEPPMQMNAKDIKDELGLIINRRNKIAHEADIDPVNRVKYPIDQAITNDTISFLKKLCESINNIINSN